VGAFPAPPDFAKGGFEYRLLRFNEASEIRSLMVQRPPSYCFPAS
jgi:hypothetical protein